MKNLIIRTISGIFFIVIMILAVWFPPYLFGIVFLGITAAALHEFYSLAGHAENIEPEKTIAMISGCILFAVFFLYYFQFASVRIFLVYVVCVLLIFIAELFRKKTNPIQNIATTLMGHIYIALPLGCISMIENQHKLFVLAFFVMIWASDTGAYLVGISFGKHKMIERISPKKSWEGFFGGLVFALVSGFIFGKVTSNESGSLLELWQWMVFALLVFGFGTPGDLIESLFKRSEKVKDSGKLMPGHGGILDRFDSAIFAAPAVFVFLNIIL